MENKSIPAIPRTDCPVCASSGGFLYEGLTDKVFSASGRWNMKKCSNAYCRTLWLDPMPAKESLPELYSGYYTHRESPDTSSGGVLRRWMERIREAYCRIEYGYSSAAPLWKDRLLSMAVRLHPLWKDNLDDSVFFLPAKPNGRLLEIGCGSGAALKSMEEKGWQVTGLDFDESAVRNARNKGLDVRLGELAKQQFDENSYDAVVMSHVLEHVPGPVDLLRECRKLLKQGGHLAVLTPNADSGMHRRYKENWRALEVPRHLQIFTPESLSFAAKEAGFSDVGISTSMNGFVYIDLASAELASGRKHVMGGPVSLFRRVQSHLKGAWVGWRHRLSPQSGVELVLMCRK